MSIFSISFKRDNKIITRGRGREVSVWEKGGGRERGHDQIMGRQERNPEGQGNKSKY